MLGFRQDSKSGAMFLQQKKHASCGHDQNERRRILSRGRILPYAQQKLDFGPKTC